MPTNASAVRLNPDPALLEKIPARVAAARRALPLIRNDNGTIAVAMADPDNVDALEELRLLLGAPVASVPCDEKHLEEALQIHYGVGAAAIEDASMVRFVDDLIRRAHRDGATDIHIEPYEGDLLLRFRVDGILQAVPAPKGLARCQSFLISRIKVMAQMNIAEKRLPQDGRIVFSTENEELDIRVSTLPTIYGESLDLRLLPKTRMNLGLAELGMAGDHLEQMSALIRRPNGILLATGPTGHGKTTTLYAGLAQINTPDKKIITIEDPVEIRLKGANQMQVHPKIGLTFANGLRSILRQDPDIIMVGEIRDKDTAEVAIRASLTGHLVFSTLHTNDAVGAVTRLVDMGIEPYLVASSVNAVLAQRLVRLCCQECHPRASGDPGDAKGVVPACRKRRSNGFPIKTFGNDGIGCESCRFTGYRGRTGIFELLIIDDDIRKLIVERAPASILREKAAASRMRTLFRDGEQKVAAGLTTLEEVLRVTEER